ncbi:MAG: heavy metal translocating P-type ATPase, partial [Alphaproteobacteria bacterium]
VGRYLDYEFRSKARKYGKSLVLSQPKVMLVEKDGILSLIPVSQAVLGDVAVVNTGEKFPADGVIIEGKSFINNSLITGESKQISVDVGSAVLSGSLNEGATVKIQITAIGENSNLGEIIKLIENAESKQNKYIQIADKVASIYTPLVLILSSITSLLWYFVIRSQGSDALLYGLSVLIITCPCALGLAVPIVQVVANGSLFKDGIILKNPEALEKLNLINAIIFDKTGTLTKTNPSLINRLEISQEDFDIISSMASYSSHPLCKALSHQANIVFDHTPVEIKGMGLETSLNGVALRLGNADFCQASGEKQDLYSEMWFKKGDRAVRLFFDNQIKDDAQYVLETLKNTISDIKVLSGDLDAPVKACADALGIKSYQSQMKPQDKLSYLQSMSQTHKVLMIGDGINDAAALKAAFVSISPSNSSALTQVNSDIVIHGEMLSPIIKALRVAKKSKKLMLQNFYIAIIYNVVSIPFAMMGMVTPLIAAIVMSTSSILVVLNSLRIR